MKKIKTFKDACEALGISTDAPIFQIESGATAFYKLEIIARATNEGWTPDWNNKDEYKYYPWFGFRGGRFVFDGVVCRCPYSLLGSRLCFRSRELAEYAGKQFENLYNELFTPSEPAEDFTNLL